MFLFFSIFKVQLHKHTHKKFTFFFLLTLQYIQSPERKVFLFHQMHDSIRYFSIYFFFPHPCWKPSQNISIKAGQLLYET